MKEEKNFGYSVLYNILKFKDKNVEIKRTIDFGGSEEGEDIVRMSE